MKVTRRYLRQLIREEVWREQVLNESRTYDLDDRVAFSLGTLTVKKEGSGWVITLKNTHLGEFGDVTVNLVSDMSWLEGGVDWGAETGDRSYQFLQSVGFPFDKHPPYDQWDGEFHGGARNFIVPRYLEEYVERFHRDERFLDKLQLSLSGRHGSLLHPVAKGIEITIQRIQSYINSTRVQNVIARMGEDVFDKRLTRFFSLNSLNLQMEVCTNAGARCWGGLYSERQDAITVDIQTQTGKTVTETVYHEFLHHWQTVFDEPDSFEWTFSSLRPEKSVVPDKDADGEYRQTYDKIQSSSNERRIYWEKWLDIPRRVSLPTNFDRNTVRQAMQKERRFFNDGPGSYLNLPHGRHHFTEKAFYQFQKNHFTMSLRRLFMVLNNLGYDLDVGDESSIARFKQGLSDFIDLRFPPQIYVENQDIFAIPLFLRNTAKNRDLIVRIGRTLASNAPPEGSSRNIA